MILPEANTGSIPRGRFDFSSSGILGRGVVVFVGFTGLVVGTNLTGGRVPSGHSNLSWSSKLAISSEWTVGSLVLIGFGKKSASNMLPLRKDKILFSLLEMAVLSVSDNIGLLVLVVKDANISSIFVNGSEVVGLGFLGFKFGLNEAGWIGRDGFRDAGWIGFSVVEKNDGNTGIFSVVLFLSLSSTMIEDSVTSISASVAVASVEGLGVYLVLFGLGLGGREPLFLSLSNKSMDGLVGLVLGLSVWSELPLKLPGLSCLFLWEGLLIGGGLLTIGLLFVISGVSVVLIWFLLLPRGNRGINGRRVGLSGATLGAIVFSLILPEKI